MHLSGTVDWLAVHKMTSHAEQFMIFALDLSTEKYKRFILPSGFNEVPFFQLVLSVLMDRLCFSYDSNKIKFVLWHMKEYKVIFFFGKKPPTIYIKIKGNQKPQKMGGSSQKPIK